MKFNTKIITEYLNSNKYDFSLFNIDYTNNETKTIKDFSITKSITYEHYGTIDTIKNMNQFLSNIGNNTKACVNNIEKIIIRLIKKVLVSYNMENFWLAIRVTLPSDNYNIPRWHKDGSLFISDENETNIAKFVTTLKGPGTLLIKSTTQINNIYNKLLEKKFKEMDKYKTIEKKIKIDDSFRPIFAKKFSKEKIIQVKNNQGVLFYTGNPENNAALHSEPKFDKSRIFISILPGSYNDIKELQKR